MERIEKGLLTSLTRIRVNAGKRHCQPCIRDLRITVRDVIEYLAGGMTTEQVLADFPDLGAPDVAAALAFAVVWLRAAGGPTHPEEFSVDERRPTDLPILRHLMERIAAAQPTDSPEFGAENIHAALVFAADWLPGPDALLELVLAEGRILSRKDFAARLRSPAFRLSPRLRRGQVLALPLTDTFVAYPEWQLYHCGPLPGFDSALTALSPLDPWICAMFFLLPDAALNGERPLDALRKGDVQGALGAAKAFAN